MTAPMARSRAGTVWRPGLLAGAGRLPRAQYQQVSSRLDPVSEVIVGGLALWYVYRVVTFRPQEAR